MEEMLDLIKKLREATECSIGECKKALEESGGDFEKAKMILSLAAAKTAAKKATRETKAGIITSYVHSNNKIGVLVELLCETDFVAKNPAFPELAKNIAMHIAGMAPTYISMSDIPEETRSAIQKQAEEEVGKLGKPTEIAKNIVEGKVSAYFGAQSLLTQPFVKDQDKTVNDLIQEAIGKFGENIRVNRFVRYEL